MSRNFNTSEYAADANPSPATIEHWRRVRKGIAKPEPHDFGGDTASAIECHRHLVCRLITEAARRQRLVEELTEARK